MIVLKPDGSLRLWVDFRKATVIAKFYAFPMPWMKEMVEILGLPNFITTLDMTKD